jgi:hypothetical protein
VPVCPAGTAVLAYGATIPSSRLIQYIGLPALRAPGASVPRSFFSRREKGGLRRVIGMDIHRTLAEVVAWEDGRLKPFGRST